MIEPKHQIYGLFLALLFWPAFLIAQETENFQWFQYYLQGPSQGTFHWNMDAGYRFRSSFDEPSQHLLRASVGHAWASGAKLNVGTAHLAAYQQNKISRFEWRPYLELLSGKRLKKLSFNQRMRLEYRHYRTLSADKAEEPSLSNRWRARYRLLISYPIEGTRWKVNSGDEIMLHYSFGEKSLELNQNRLLIGPAFQLTPQVGLSILMNFQKTRISDGLHRNDYVFWLGINQKI